MRWMVIALLLTVSPILGAHQKPIAFSSWTVNGDQVSADIYLSALGRWKIPSDIKPDEYFKKNIHLYADDKPCQVTPPVNFERSGMAIRANIRFDCAGKAPTKIHFDALFDNNPTHLHVLTYQDKDFVLNIDKRDVSLSDGISSVLSYLWIGIDHILSGYDHLAFVLGLLLICRSLREVIICVTGFTLGHSLTLCLAYLGILSANIPAVEALVGYSIAIVAIERADLKYSGSIIVAIGLLAISTLFYGGVFTLPMIFGFTLFALCYLALVKKQDWRPLILPSMTITFGLLHGFAFAGFLSEIQIPKQEVIWALFQFNLGVEVGQIAVAVVCYYLLRAVGRDSLVSYAIAGGLCGLGVFWFLTRSII